MDYVGLEVKTSYSAEGWGEDGTRITSEQESWDAVPIDYLLQVQHYLYVTGWPTMLVAVLIGHDDFRTYDVEPIPALIEPMIEEEVRFWNEHVTTGSPPALDASEGTRAYLRAKFPRAMGVLRTASPDETVLIEKVRAAAEAEREAHAEHESLMNTGSKLRAFPPGSWRRPFAVSGRRYAWIAPAANASAARPGPGRRGPGGRRWDLCRFRPAPPESRPTGS